MLAETIIDFCSIRVEEAQRMIEEFNRISGRQWNLFLLLLCQPNVSPKINDVSNWSSRKTLWFAIDRQRKRIVWGKKRQLIDDRIGWSSSENKTAARLFITSSSFLSFWHSSHRLHLHFFFLRSRRTTGNCTPFRFIVRRRHRSSSSKKNLFRIKSSVSKTVKVVYRCVWFDYTFCASIYRVARITFCSVCLFRHRIKIPQLHIRHSFLPSKPIFMLLERPFRFGSTMHSMDSRRTTGELKPDTAN